MFTIELATLLTIEYNNEDEDDENILKLVDKKRKKKSTKMFSFHKPKIYRSNSGCCICRAKSSSSRFTDSKKYEAEFEKCFRIDEKRTGEICNACVLLVKRWKKLPTGTNKNWHHVVDARAGPGTKSFKSSSKSSTNMDDKRRRHHRLSSSTTTTNVDNTTSMNRNSKINNNNNASKCKCLK